MAIGAVEDIHCAEAYKDYNNINCYRGLPIDEQSLGLYSE